MKKPFGKSWLDTFFARKTTDKLTNVELSGKVVVFTGGTDGMGRVAVERFAEMGADICLFGRNLEKARAVETDIKAAGSRGQFSIVECDIGSLDHVRKASDDVLQRHGRVDFLINCAGANLSERRLSSDGYEMNFVVNYLGPFLLTELLLERIKMTPNARIIHVTSATQNFAKLQLDDLHFENNSWSMLKSYAQAKLYMIMHVRDLATRLTGSTVSVNALNPGYIQTNLLRHAKGFEKVFIQLFGGLAAPTWVGGERILCAALDPQYEIISGKYIYEDMLLDPNPLALDDANVSRLMQLSHDLTGLNKET
ncbi:MAG: SDR family NAD(P)-dependent oxidoreductase [Aestuariivita sp.]|nr:SDR family NAD(P)-dependent oxidoreductase [Aestuariivita sp.]